MKPPGHITVLGAGLTGLSTAWRLSHLLPSTSRITLLESSDRIGGWVQSSTRQVGFRDEQGNDQEGEVILELGPRSIRPTGSKGAAGMLKLIRELGLENSIVPVSKSHPSTRNRYIIDLERLNPTLSLIRLNPFSTNSVPSFRTVLVAALEPFASRRTDVEDESVDSFIRRRFGAGVADLASAGMHGIYAASSHDLSARAILGRVYEAEATYRSVILGLLLGSFSGQSKREKNQDQKRWAELGELGEVRKDWAMYGLKGGLETLTSALAKGLQDRGVELRLREKVTRVKAERDHIFISTQSGTFSTDHLISALSPSRLSTLVHPHLPHLSYNPSTSVGVVTIVYPLSPSSVHPDGFGYLTPRPRSLFSPTQTGTWTHPNEHGVLGVIFDSTALPGLDSTNMSITKLTVMLGGPYWSSYPSSPSSSLPLPRPTSPDDLINPALGHLHRVFPVLKNLKPLIVAPNLNCDCIPTYLPGHNSRLKDLHQEITTGEWACKLSLTGNGYGGVGVNDCVWSGEIVARGIAEGYTPTGLEAWDT